jgi:curved DNA-binding protein CbpA
VEAKLFVNFYEVFELDPNAGREVIEHRFRQLARRYHPDNGTTGDRARFDTIVEAHETLKDPHKRAQYHEQHKSHLPPLLASAAEDSGDAESEDNEDIRGREGLLDEMGIDRDISIQNIILTLLYHRRRQHIREPGIGNAELEHLSGCPHEHLEFHIWYLKAKGWIATVDNGLLAITIDGVDRAASIYRERAAKRITDQS